MHGEAALQPRLSVYFTFEILPTSRWHLAAASIEGGVSQVTPGTNKLPASAGDRGNTGSIPGSGRSPGGVYGNPLQYTCLENPVDRDSWWLHTIGSQRVGLN